MSKCLEIAVTFIVSAFILSSISFADDSVTITTYYPAPYGVYKEMRLYPNTSPNDCDANNKGSMYYHDVEGLKVCDGASWQGLGGGCSDVPGADQSNCWKDVDGDGRSARTGDCNEGCPTCYSGSTTSPATPDGKDQNCNGTIDEIGIGFEKTCMSSYNLSAAHVASACSSYCSSIGRSYYYTNCQSGLGSDSINRFINFSTCGFIGAGSYVDAPCFDYEVNPFPHTIKCTCKGHP